MNILIYYVQSTEKGFLNKTKLKLPFDSIKMSPFAECALGLTCISWPCSISTWFSCSKITIVRALAEFPSFMTTLYTP